MISALALFALPAQASFIQELFASDGTRFGVLEFDTISGSDTKEEFGITGLHSASVEVGGITWTVADAVGGSGAWTWDGVDTDLADMVIQFVRGDVGGSKLLRWQVTFMGVGWRTNTTLMVGVVPDDRDQRAAGITLRDSTTRVVAVPAPGT